eukprot:gene11026-14807_t
MSARAELKAKSLKRQTKRFVKSLQKKKYTPPELIDGYSVTLNTKEEEISLDKGKSKKRKYSLVPSIPQISSHSFKKCFWIALELDKDEDIKLIRKSIGVTVKGNIISCPPPLKSIADIYPFFSQNLFSHFKISEPTPVQNQCWPALLSGCNVIGISPTGSGKTLSYCLPLIPHVDQYNSKSLKTVKRISPLALIMVPTRELALQVYSVLKACKRSSSILPGVVYGGQDRDDQLMKLAVDEGINVLVATPGRALDFIQNGNISVSHVTYFVIDEADRMLNLGFLEQLEAISNFIRPDRQTVLFSATFPGKLRERAELWAKDAIIVRCNTLEYGNSTTTDENTNEMDDKNYQVLSEKFRGGSISISKSIIQKIHVCASHKKPRILLKYITTIRTQEKQDKIRQPGVIHGQLQQSVRECTLNSFKAGKIHTLIATDVAARGIHIKKLRYVINYDFPTNIEQYCHRVGRTGRQNETGEAYSLFSRNMAPLASDLISLLKICNQPVEPNLSKLADEFISGTFVHNVEEAGDANDTLDE